MKSARLFIVCLLATVLFASQTMAQTTEFTYQGRLLSGGLPANGNFDFEFRLFDDVAVGTQLGPIVPLTSVNVVNGVFSVRIDFGDQFPGPSRFLEIRVRQAGDQFFTVLSPRQPITSAPYAIKSLHAADAVTANNTTQLGGVAAAQFIQTTDARLSDARDPKSGSTNYIQNSTTRQASSNFNISGNGTSGGTLSGNIVNADTQYNFFGIRVLSASQQTGNLSTGLNSGSVDSGQSNSFYGVFAGNHTTGNFNSFFGFSSGFFNSTGGFNSFFGQGSGGANTTASNNSFFGAFSGSANSTGQANSFFGSQAGLRNNSGGSNSFFGSNAGLANTTGSSNAFF